MIHELRIYHAMPGRLPDLNARFTNYTLKIWERFDIKPTGFWTTLVGDNNNDLTYLLEWDSLADREQKWNAFIADKEWQAVRAETEKNGPLVSSISNSILAPTPYSAIR